MMDRNSINGLTLGEVCSEIETGQGSSQELSAIINGRISEQMHHTLVMMDHKVNLGMYSGGEFIQPPGYSLEPRHLQSLRIFNQEEELYLWRTEPGQFQFRWRLEKGFGKPWDIADARQMLWGTNRGKRMNADWAYLQENRGIELLIPHCLMPDDNSRVWLATRYYIDYNPLGQAGYIDCRFVDIGPKGE